jgi:hypothetical protein
MKRESGDLHTQKFLDSTRCCDPVKYFDPTGHFLPDGGWEGDQNRESQKTCQSFCSGLNIFFHFENQK